MNNMQETSTHDYLKMKAREKLLDGAGISVDRMPMPVVNLLKLGRGAVIPLDHRVGEPVDIIVNGRIIARGEIVVVEDDNSRLGVSLTEIAGPARTAA